MCKVLTHLDLFSGIGGFALAAQRCGLRTVAFVECDPYCQAVLRQHWPGVPIHDDIKAFKWPVADAARRESGEQEAGDGRQGVERTSEALSDASSERRCGRFEDGTAQPPSVPRSLDSPGRTGDRPFLLSGGFPCQPFSTAGKRRGAADDRHLWPQMLRVIQESRPRWVLAENVPGIIKMELDTVLADLEGEGYTTGTVVIPACAVDAPHRRDRVWIVAHAEFPAGGRGAADRAVRDERRAAERSGRAGLRQRDGQPCSGDAEPSGEDVAHADRGRRAQCDQGERRVPEPDAGGCCLWPDEDEWFAQSGMGRVAFGVPNRVHRLRALGNAIVPQVAEELIRMMLMADGGRDA